jgi:hypothetical protein
MQWRWSPDWRAEVREKHILVVWGGAGLWGWRRGFVRTEEEVEQVGMQVGRNRLTVLGVFKEN